MAGRITGGGVRRGSEPTEAVVDKAHDAQLEYYYRNDLTICKTSSMLANAVFRNEWLVRWGGTIPMAYFKVPYVKSALELLLRDMRDMLRLKRYVGLYVYKDMEKWMQEFEESMEYTTGIPSNNVMLPCGLVTPEMGRFVQIAPRGVYSAARILNFEPSDEELGTIYRFVVYDRGARFYDTTASSGSPAGNGIMGGMSTYSNISLDSHSIRVASEFVELYEMRSKLEEAERYMFDTAFSAAHPLSYMTAKAMPHDPIEELTDESLTTARDMNDVRTKNKSLHTMKFTLNTAVKMAKNITRAMGAASGQKVTMDSASATMERMSSGGNDTIRKGLADMYGRVDPSENLVPLADFVDVSTPNNPTVVIDVPQLRTQYEIAVCRCMDVPYSFYRTEIETSGHSGGASNMILSESIISAAVADEQSMYSEIFSWLYMNAFSVLDQSLFESIADDVDAMEDMEVQSDNTQHVLRFLAAMTQRRESYAKLEFELLTVTNPDSLNAMILAQQMGLVTRHLVERNAARLYGHTIGRDNSMFVLRSDPSLRTNFNAPLQPPVTPDMEAKLNNDKKLAKMKPPPSKKQKMK
jgi:hypothetical protein